MKSKSSFTIDEAAKIIALIKDKLKASPSQQKSIRNKIRNIGFYYSDFGSNKDGYTVDDFLALIRAKQVKLSGDQNSLDRFSAEYMPSIYQQKVTPAQTPVPSEINRVPVPIKEESVSTDRLQFGKFDPLSSSPSILPDSPGIYLLCLRNGSKFPEVEEKPFIPKVNNFDLLYIGISNLSIRSRDYRQHFSGNAGGSTLRKSLGCLFGYKQIPRDKNEDSNKTKFSYEDESNLSVWMKNNLLLFYTALDNPDAIETELIRQYDPPLNLSKASSIQNQPFRSYLSKLRSQR